MSTPNKLTPATIAEAIATEVAKPGIVQSELNANATAAIAALDAESNNLENTTAAKITELYKAKLIAIGAAEIAQGSLNLFEQRAAQKWIGDHAARIVETYQGEHDSRLKATTPVRESWVEKLTAWTRSIRGLRGNEKTAEVERRDAAEAQLDELEWRFDMLQTAIDRFTTLPNSETLAGISSSLGALDCEIAKAAKAAKP